MFLGIIDNLIMYDSLGIWWLGMSKPDIVVYLLIYLGAIFFTIDIWFGGVTLESKYIPTILNGLVSSVSIMLGFIATAVAIMLQRKGSEFPEGLHLDTVIWSLFIPIFLIFYAYSLLIDADFQGAIKSVMTALAVSYCIIVHILFRLSRMVIDMKFRAHKHE